jgi:hypothetical protein
MLRRDGRRRQSRKLLNSGPKLAQIANIRRPKNRFISFGVEHAVLEQLFWPHRSELVLDEDAHRHYFTATPALYAICMDVAPTIWDKTLMSPFRSLKTAYEGRLNSALAGIQRGLRGH